LLENKILCNVVRGDINTEESNKISIDLTMLITNKI